LGMNAPTPWDWGYGSRLEATRESAYRNNKRHTDQYEYHRSS